MLQVINKLKYVVLLCKYVHKQMFAEYIILADIVFILSVAVLFSANTIYNLADIIFILSVAIYKLSVAIYNLADIIFILSVVILFSANAIYNLADIIFILSVIIFTFYCLQPHKVYTFRFRQQPEIY